MGFVCQTVRTNSNDAFLLDFEKLWTHGLEIGQKIFIAAYPDAVERVGQWYGIKREWAVNPYVLELYLNVTGSERVGYRFYVYESALFALKVHYFDFAGYYVPFVFYVDNTPVGEIHYEALQKPQEIELPKIFLQSGWHEIYLQPRAEGQLMINVDYILLEQAMEK
jgi:hypothetical protein